MIPPPDARLPLRNGLGIPLAAPREQAYALAALAMYRPLMTAALVVSRCLFIKASSNVCAMAPLPYKRPLCLQ